MILKDKKIIAMLGLGILSAVVVTYGTTKNYQEDRKSLREGQKKYYEDGQFHEDLEKLSKINRPMHEATELMKQGEWDKAKDKLLLALKQRREAGLKEWIPRNLLLDVYENLGDTENAFEQLDWLIEHTKNDETLKKLHARKIKISVRSE